MANESTETNNLSHKRDFFGHPRGLSTLFFTEFWERFSYYGMRALLVLFMVAAIKGDNPGLGFTDGRATAIYGIYTFFVYVLSLPGGWVADNIWGQRKSVFVGGCIIALGHFTMAGPLIGLPNISTFYLGLMFITLGTGLLKPNVSVMVGGLYPEGGSKRDAGFSIFYMGINFGAILGPTLCSLMAQGINWHWGFSLAGFGMLIGLFFYKMGEPYLQGVGLLEDQNPQKTKRLTRNFYMSFVAFIILVGFVAWMVSSGALGITLQELAGWLGTVTVVLTFVFFGYIIFFGGHTSREKKRLVVILWLFILAAIFWSGFEQAGSSLNLFAKRRTDRIFGPYGWISVVTPYFLSGIVAVFLGYISYRIFKREHLWNFIKGIIAVISAAVAVSSYFLFANLAHGWTMPASMLQNINPLWIVIFAPVFGALWVWLAKRNANPSIPVKFALGLFGLAAGFVVIAWGASVSSAANKASPAWLVVTYFLFTVGELCLSPIGLSSMTKLAPEGRGSQMMGIWFVAAALGSLFAGLLAGEVETLAPHNLFWLIVMISGGSGLVALLVSPGVKKLMGDVK